MKKMRNVFADSMLELGQVDPRLVVMVGDISHGILQPFAKACPGRYFNVGICEPTIVNMAAGVAKSGLIPVIHTIAPFIIERAFEQIKLDFGYQGLSGNFISVGSAFDYSQLGCSHHCYSDVPLMMQLTRSQIFFPASPVEFQGLFNQAYTQNTINYFRLPERTHGIVFEPSEIQVGQAIRVVEGDDLTILVIGSQLATALNVQKTLEEQGINLEILYYPTLKPFDEKALRDSVKKTKNLLVMEEIYHFGGMFSKALEVIRDIQEVKVHSIAIQDFIHTYGTYEELASEVGFSSEGIIQTIREKYSIGEKTHGRI